jgi:integrase
LSLKASDRHVDFWDKALPSFGVRVSPRGTRTFILKIHNGRQSIGRYPILTLSQARTEAKRRLAEKTLGKLRPASVTFSAAVNLFIEEKRKSRRASTADQYEWFLGRLNFTGQLAGITADDISRALKRVKSKSTNDHVLIAARIFFNWCLKRGYVEKNPTVGLSPHTSSGRARVLSDEELVKIWRTCSQVETRDAVRTGFDAPPSDRAADPPANYAKIVKLLIVTGQRRGEIAALRTSFIEGTLVTFPNTLTKNGHEHVFPLSNLAAEILRSVDVETDKKDALFFLARGKTDKSFSGWSKAMKALRAALGEDVPHFTLHDFRRTFRTNLGRLGIAPHIAERLVNHVNSRSNVEKIYDRWTYMPELRAAVQRFDEWFSTLIR